MEQPYQIDPKYGGIEYESVAELGADCGVDDLALLSKANERCNALGLDTTSPGATVACCMARRPRGLIPDPALSCPSAQFGNRKAVLASPSRGAPPRRHGTTP